MKMPKVLRAGKLLFSGPVSGYLHHKTIERYSFSNPYNVQEQEKLGSFPVQGELNLYQYSINFYLWPLIAQRGLSHISSLFVGGDARVVAWDSPHSKQMLFSLNACSSSITVAPAFHVQTGRWAAGLGPTNLMNTNVCHPVARRESSA